ncbi:hypothetical protein SDC9_79723 [bioreactor metagenome]|uniref:Uncharacterized protein n=1 Tax=bioreactor metagenome TaxID=1076179 RepID=A0A644Z4Y2_9ZZZZ
MIEHCLQVCIQLINGKVADLLNGKGLHHSDGSNTSASLSGPAGSQPIEALQVEQDDGNLENFHQLGDCHVKADWFPIPGAGSLREKSHYIPLFQGF